MIREKGEVGGSVAAQRSCVCKDECFIKICVVWLCRPADRAISQGSSLKKKHISIIATGLITPARTHSCWHVGVWEIVCVCVVLWTFDCLYFWHHVYPGLAETCGYQNVVEV